MPIEEHDGRVLTNPEQLVPFSLAQYIAQTTQSTATDRHGSAVLRSVDNVTYFDPEFPFIRTVFNVVRNSDLSAPIIQATFVGLGSAVCSHPEVIKLFGFKPVENCGATVPTTTAVTTTPANKATATVTRRNGGPGVPTGSMVFRYFDVNRKRLRTDAVGNLDNTGNATSPFPVPAGTREIKASYMGNNQYQNSGATLPLP